MILAVIVLFALALRVVVAVGVSRDRITGDPAFYDRVGVSLALVAALVWDSGVGLVAAGLAATYPPVIALGAMAAPAALIVAALLTIVPWTIRNLVVLHAVVPVSTNLGRTLAGTILAAGLGSRSLARFSIAGFAVTALPAAAGAFTRRARAAPGFFWLIPALLWLSTVVTAGHFSRFRAPLDPFLVMLAALAVAAAAERRAG